MIFQSLPISVSDSIYKFHFKPNHYWFSHSITFLCFLWYIIIEQLSWNRVKKKWNMHLHPPPFYIPGDVVHVWDLGFGHKRQVLSTQKRCFLSRIKIVLTVLDRLWTYITTTTPMQGGFRQKQESKPQSSDDVSLERTVSGREDLHTSHKTAFTRLISSTKSPNKIMERSAFFRLRLQLPGLTHLCHQKQAFSS